MKKILSLLGLLSFLALSAFAVKTAYAACYPKPLSDASVRSNYAWAQKVARASSAELERLYRRSRGEVSSPQELRRVAQRYVAKPLSFHLREMRNYRVACARGGDGGGKWQRPGPEVPECSSNSQCSGNYHCAGGKCLYKGNANGRCNYSDKACAPGFHCNDGVCE
jgi:hypothetical protein